MRKGRIPIRRFSAGSIVLAVVLSVFFAAISLQGVRDLHEFEEAMEQYLRCEKDAENLQNGSDVLTEQARLYVVTGRREYLDGYFQEANVSRSRENAVEDLGRFFADTQVFSELEKAMSESRALMNTEYYAMYLAAVGLGQEDTLPAEVSGVSLTAEDLALEDREKVSRAQALLFDEDYQSSKGRIRANVEKCMADLVALTQQRQSAATGAFKRLYIQQEVSIGLLVVLVIAICIAVRRLVVDPLLRYDSSIRQDEPVPVEGAAELQTLALTYNRILQENRETQRIVRHEAEHDALTDLLNRGSFNKILAIYQQGQVPFALILADVDRFKSVNDTYGHETGDAILKEFSAQLRAAFRSTDFIFRIGGDEFAVLMPDTTEQIRTSIGERLSALRRGLTLVKEHLPRVTASAGIAFSGQTGPEGVFKAADMALYYVKNHGRDGYRFSGESGLGD